MKRCIAVVTLVLLCFSQAWAQSSVWKARKGDSVIYLGGTCHLLRESDYPLPAEFEKAYQAAQVVVFETDIARLNDPATQQKLLAKALYADGSTIDRHLSPKVYAALKAYCDASGIPLQALSRMKPSLLMVTLTVLELSKMGVSQRGVDQYFHEKAVSDRKPVEGLESVDEQIDFVVSMADGTENEFVTNSLEDMKVLKVQFGLLLQAWRAGDAGALDELLVAEMKSRFPALYRKLITARNLSWLPLIEGYGKTPVTEFILVGAAHLVGDDGILAVLKRKGYTVEQL